MTFDNHQLTLADVIGSSYDWDYDDEPEPWYRLYEDYDEPEELDWDLYNLLNFDMGEPEDEDDPNEIVLPLIEKISPTAALGHRMAKPCPHGCCSDRRLRHRRRPPKFNVKPKRKDHRCITPTPDSPPTCSFPPPASAWPLWT